MYSSYVERVEQNAPILRETCHFFTFDLPLPRALTTSAPILSPPSFPTLAVQDGQVEDSAMLCAIVNDLYDYPRDVDEDTHLNVWNYFDSVDDAISFVKGVFDDVYSRVSPDMQSWIDRYMLYQKDEDVQSLRGFDREWYNKLNAFFS